jgi:hypothetical protein
MNAQEDELLLFQHYQGLLESIRDLQKQKPWPEVSQKEMAVYKELDRFAGKSIGYYFSLNIIPNGERAFQSAVQNETMRQLTITAIALKRYELGHHRLPSDLAELVPEFLSAVPIDPMSGQPLRYHLNADGSFVLYSVGEDGHDDGGNPNPPKSSDRPGLWSGRDAVWPVAAPGPARTGN